MMFIRRQIADRRQPLSGRAGRGFALLSAIFLLVVISSLGLFAVTLTSSQNQSQVLDVLGSRAYQAARAGIEWAAYSAMQNAASSSAVWAGCTSSGSLTGLSGVLAPFTVSLSCSASSAVEGTTTIWVYNLSATAIVTGTLPGSANYVERVISFKMGM